MSLSLVMVELASWFPRRVRGVTLIWDREVGGLFRGNPLPPSPERKPQTTEWRRRKRERRTEQVKHALSFIFYNGGFCFTEERIVSFLLVGSGAGGFSPGTEEEQEEQEEKWPQFGSEPKNMSGHSLLSSDQNLISVWSMWKEGGEGGGGGGGGDLGRDILLRSLLTVTRVQHHQEVDSDTSQHQTAVILVLIK